MKTPRRARGRGGLFFLSFCLVVVGAMIAALLSPALVPLQADGPGADISLASNVQGSFTPFQPGELWGGGNSAEHCVTCNATSLLGEDSAQSLQSGQDVDPATGDYSTSLTLLSVPTAAGTFGVSLTYDAQRAIAERRHPTSYPYQKPGHFGWGWQSSLSVSLYSSGTGYQVNEANGAEVNFSDIGSAEGDIDADGCPPGAYPDWQKYTVAASTTAFCAPTRVDAQLGTTTALGMYQYDVAGGRSVDVFNYFGQLVQDGNQENPDAVSFKYGVKPTTTGCPRTTGATATCTIETDLVAGRKIVAQDDYFGVASAVIGPTGAEYKLTYNGDAQLTSVENPTGDVTHFGYATTLAQPYEAEMTSITDPDGNASHVVYATGMVTQLIDPSNQYTTYSYQTPNCATTAGCVGSDNSQVTTVKYDDGEVDHDDYNGGVLASDCYGSVQTGCGSDPSWTFNYDFDTGNAPDGTSVETVVLPGGAHATVTTDAAGNVVAYTDPNGNVTHDMWNDSGYHDLDELCWSAPSVTNIPASANCTTKPTRGTTYTYDQYGDRLSVKQPIGNPTRYGYYDNGELCWTAPPSVSGGSTCPNGGSSPAGAPAGSTAYVYDPESDLVQTAVAYGTGTAQTTTSTYDVMGQITATIPPDGQGHGGFGSNPYETTTTYRASGLVQQTTAPLSDKTTYGYDGDGQVTTETDPGGVTTTTYDPEGRVCWSHRGTAKVTTACNPGTAGPAGSTTYTYLATTTAPTAVTNPDSNITRYTYANKSYPTEATEVADPMGTQAHYTTYTTFGHACISGPVNPGGSSCGSPVSGDTWSEYDAEGQLETTADPGGTRTTYAYTKAGFPLLATSVTYGSRTTTYGYDSDGRQSVRTGPTGLDVITAYNTDGQVCMTAPVAWFPICPAPSVTGTTTYTYNAAGELTQMVDNHGTANQTTATYHYDADGHLLSTTTDNGRTVSYSYNDAAEVSCVGYPVKSGANCANGPSTSNTVVDRTYNAAGQLTKTTDWLGHSIGYSGYTPNGKLETITYPSSTGESLGYHYDAAGEMTTANYSGPAVGSVSDTYGHNPDSQLSSVTGLGGFSSPSDTYNSYSRVATATDPTSPSGSVKDTYNYKANGAITTITPTHGATQTDTYNTEEELTAQSQPVTTAPLGTGIGTPETPISVPNYPVAVAVVPSGTSAYAVAIGNFLCFLKCTQGTLSKITGKRDRRTSSTTAGYAPDAIAVNPAGTKAYVVVAASKAVRPFTLSTMRAGSTIPVGTGPDAIAINPAGTKAYVTNASSNNVTPITLTSGTAGTAIPVGSDPKSIAVAPNGTTAYVTNGTSDSVTPITLGNNTAEAAIALGQKPQGIAVNAKSTMAYVAAGTHSLIPVTLSSKTAKTAITVGTSPYDVVVAPNSNTAFVSDSGSNAVTTVTLLYNTKVGTTTVGTYPLGLAITPKGTRLYVAEEDSTAVLPIDLTSRGVRSTPHDAYNVDGERCWSAASTVAGSCTQAPTDATSYGWNDLGQLCWSGATTVSSAPCTAPPTGTTTYRTNGLGLRTKETPPSGSALTFTYDMVSGGSLPEDIDDGTNAYVYGPTSSAPAEQVNLSTGVVDYLATTQSGVQTVFNGSGSLQEEATYTTYGTQLIQQGSKVTPFGFQGTYNTSSGLDYLVNRYYTPKAAQFLSVDPNLTSTHEPYAFTGGDPLNATDPLGLEWYWIPWTIKATKWNTYQGTTYAYECGGSVGNRSHNETTGDHCGSKWCTNGGPCTTHTAQAFDDSYGGSFASDAPGESASSAPTNTVAAFLQAMAKFSAYLSAVVAHQQALQEDRASEERSEEGPIDPATMGPIYSPPTASRAKSTGQNTDPTGVFGAVARTGTVVGSAAACGGAGGLFGLAIGNVPGAIVGAGIGIFTCGIYSGVTGNWTTGTPGPQPAPDGER